GAVVDQAASRDELTKWVHRWHRMLGRQGDKLIAYIGEKRVTHDEERARSLLNDACEGSIEFANVAGSLDKNFLTQRARRRLHLSQLSISIRIFRIAQTGDLVGAGNQLAQNLESLRVDADVDITHARCVSAGPAEAGDEA